MSASESPAHLELKRLALIWAQANGYQIAACEVSLPNLRFRLDVAAYRPASTRVIGRDERRGKDRAFVVPALGVSAIFECKASRANLVRDCRNSAQLIARMKELTEARIDLERHLKIHCPSLLKGDGLWPEYDTAAFSSLHGFSRQLSNGRTGGHPHRLLGTLLEVAASAAGFASLSTLA